MTAILAGAEPLSHVGTSTTGVLALHGFTGNPSSMRADRRRHGRARLPRRTAPASRVTAPSSTTCSTPVGPTGARAVEEAYQRLAERVERRDRRRAEHGWLAHVVDRTAAPRDRRHRVRQSGDPPPAGRRDRDGQGDGRRGQRGDARDRRRHRRPRRRRVGVLRHAVAAAVVVPDRRRSRRWPTAITSCRCRC